MNVYNYNYYILPKGFVLLCSNSGIISKFDIYIYITQLYLLYEYIHCI